MLYGTFYHNSLIWMQNFKELEGQAIGVSAGKKKSKNMTYRWFPNTNAFRAGNVGEVNLCGKDEDVCNKCCHALFFSDKQFR